MHNLTGLAQSLRMTQRCVGDRPQPASASMQSLSTATTQQADVRALEPFKIERVDLASRESGENQRSPLLSAVRCVGEGSCQAWQTLQTIMLGS